jgi:membrane fusion protein (multidrug efflux system)
MVFRGFTYINHPHHLRVFSEWSGMFKHRGIWLIVIVIVVAAGVALTNKKAANGVPPELTNVAPQVIEFLPADLVNVEVADISKVLSLSGAMRAYSQAVVKAKLVGDVREVLVREGESVQPGQALVKMDTADYESRLAQAQGALNAAQGQLEIARLSRDNNQSLLNKNFISKTAFDNASNQFAIAAANVESAKGALAVSQKALADTVIRAPIEGVISSRTVQPGEKISPDNRLFEIVDLHMLEMEAPVPTQDIASIKIGQSVQITLDGVKADLSGKVSRINPATVSGSRSIMVYIQIANPDGALRAGMFGQAQLVLSQKKDVLAIPRSAVQYDAGNPFVYSIENMVLLKKTISLGLSGESNGREVVEVLSGLNEGAKVVKTNLGSLQTGMPVKLAPPVQSAGKV